MLTILLFVIGLETPLAIIGFITIKRWIKPRETVIEERIEENGVTTIKKTA